MSERYSRRTVYEAPLDDLAGTLTAAVEQAIAKAGAMLVASVPDVIASRHASGCEAAITMRPRHDAGDAGWTVTVSLHRGMTAPTATEEDRP